MSGIGVKEHMNRSVTRLSLVTIVLALFANMSDAQAPAAAKFDVSSVKVNRSGAPFRVGPMLQPGGRVIATNLALRDLIRAAYGVDDNQLVGGPAWIDADRFDVEARGPADLTPARGQAMLRDLLADRFKLVAHPETRQLPIYRLVMARRDRAPGPRLKPSGPECAPITPPPGIPTPPPPPPPTGGGGVPLTDTDGTPRRCGTMMFPGAMSTRSVTLSAFAKLLSFGVGRPVVDETGWAGAFDIDLTYTPDLGAAVSQTAPSANTAPSLFTALEEQLGLKLESARGPVNVVVIDRAERPAEN